MPLLSKDLSLPKREKKLSNLISELSSKEHKIRNVSASAKYAEWKLMEK
jgi:hypothetical protein